MSYPICFSHSRDGAGLHPVLLNAALGPDGGQPHPYCGVITDEILDATAPLMLAPVARETPWPSRHGDEARAFL